MKTMTMTIGQVKLGFLFVENAVEAKSFVAIVLGIDDAGPPDSFLGWYWWRKASDGSLGYGLPCGPFQTEENALRDAKENLT